MTSLEIIRKAREDLELQEKALITEEKRLQEERRKSVKRKWRFTFAPTDVARMSWDKVRDPSVTYYVLKGEITNVEECKAAGHSEDSMKSGSMGYLFNSLSGKIMMRHGGGTIYINDDPWGKDKAVAKREAEEVFTKLEAFIKEHPEGGDVTDIIMAQTTVGWFES